MLHFCLRTQDITFVWMGTDELKTTDHSSCFNISELLTLAASSPCETARVVDVSTAAIHQLRSKFRINKNSYLVRWSGRTGLRYYGQVMVRLNCLAWVPADGCRPDPLQKAAVLTKIVHCSEVSFNLSNETLISSADQLFFLSKIATWMEFGST